MGRGRGAEGDVRGSVNPSMSLNPSLGGCACIDLLAVSLEVGPLVSQAPRAPGLVLHEPDHILHDQACGLGVLPCDEIAIHNDMDRVLTLIACIEGAQRGEEAAGSSSQLYLPPLSLMKSSMMKGSLSKYGVFEHSYTETCPPRHCQASSTAWREAPR
jgi:hypothetical protein